MARPGCSCRTSTSGRAPSGWPACGSWTTTSRASGRSTATTTAAIPGSSSATRATEMERAGARSAGRGDRRGDHGERPSAPRPSASRFRSRPVTSPASTSSSGSPRLTATAPRGPTRSPRRRTTRRRARQHRDHRRASRGRRGLLLLGRRGRPRGRARGAGPDRGVVRLARRHPGAARRRRIGRRAPHGDAAPGAPIGTGRPRPPRRLGAAPCRDLYYADELPGPETTVVYTREAPPRSSRPAGRLVAADLAGIVSARALRPTSAARRASPTT